LASEPPICFWGESASSLRKGGKKRKTNVDGDVRDHLLMMWQVDFRAVQRKKAGISPCKGGSREEEKGQEKENALLGMARHDLCSPHVDQQLCSGGRG
jgi:hypothetical protein